MGSDRPALEPYSEYIRWGADNTVGRWELVCVDAPRLIIPSGVSLAGGEGGGSSDCLFPKMV